MSANRAAHTYRARWALLALVFHVAGCSAPQPMTLPSPRFEFTPRVVFATDVCDSDPLLRVLKLELLRRQNQHVGCGNAEPILQAYKQLASEAGAICAAAEAERVARISAWRERGWWLGCLGSAYEIAPLSSTFGEHARTSAF